MIKCTPSRLVTVGEVDKYPPSDSKYHNSKHPKANLPKKNIYIHKKKIIQINQDKKITEHIHVCTLNTRTLRTEESLKELEIAISNIKWDVMGISEMRRPGEGIEERSDYIMFHKGKDTGHKGVGFLIKSKLKKNILGFEGVSDRIAVVHLKFPGYKKNWVIFQIYAPTEQAGKSDVEYFYESISEAIKPHYNNNIIIMGDFNAQVGERQIGEESSIGKFGHGKRSQNGQKLTDFMMENNLTLMNSRFYKKTKSKWTWSSPGEKFKTEIDFIITNKASAFTDTDIVKNLNFNTDHRMVRSCLSLNQPKRSRKNIANNNKLYQISEHSQLANSRTSESLNEIITSDAETGIKYRRLQNKLKEMLVRKPRSKESYLSKETLELLEERRTLISNKGNKERRQKIANLSKKIKENMRKDRKNKRNRVLEENIKRTGGTKKAMKQLSEHGKEWISKLKQRESYLTNRPSIQKLATDYYRLLYSDKFDSGLATIPETNEAKENKVDKVPEILASEVIKAIKSQKPEKAPGPDRIPNEMLKGNIEEISPALAKLFNEILQTRQIPEEWTECHIILLHKKGPRDEIGNYRPISLISNIYKVFAKVIMERISSKLNESQPVEQAGFRKNFSTIDHIHTIKQLIQKYNEYNKQIYLAFIDYSKAFDSLRHYYIWRCLEQQGIQSSYIEILKSIYKSSKASIKLESTGESFPIKKGVRQGDPLSPTLFNAVLEHIFRQLNWDHLGLNINGARLNHLRFADDLVLLEENPTELEQMMQSLANISREVGLEINACKTKLMSNSREIDIMVDGNKIEYVKEYIYLGQIISPTDAMTKEINRRIAQGWKKYWSLKEIVKSKDIGNHIKKKTFETCILPVLTYGCETWSTTLHHRERLIKCQRAMERSMLGLKIKDRVRNIDIRTRTKLTDILTRIDVQKWRWAGHLLRHPINKWSKQVTLWLPRGGKRSRGRQVRRWEDDLKQTAGPFWSRVARDRIHWKELEEAYAKRHTELRDLL